MRHKMITLCPTTYDKASKIKNFSGWIRWCSRNRKDLLKVQDVVDDRDYLQSEVVRYEQLIQDIIDGKKRFVKDKGWIKNMYKEDEE